MKIVFLGTPKFALEPLKSLLLSHHELVGVVTQIDKPVGRSGKDMPPPIKEFALTNNIPIFQFEKIREQGVEALKSLKADLFVTCAYGQILSEEIIDIPKYGILNIHTSLLPKYRGSSPVQWAILRGEKETGVTIMRTDIGVDTGDILIQETVQIADKDNSETLLGKLSIVGAKLIIDAIELLENKTAVFVPQINEESTHFPMLKKSDGIIDFSLPAYEIVNKIRAFNPWPTAYTFIGGTLLKIWDAEFEGNEENDDCGCVVSVDTKNGIRVACGRGILKILEVQMSGSRRMLACDFVKGKKVKVGTILESV